MRILFYKEGKEVYFCDEYILMVEMGEDVFGVFG